MNTNKKILLVDDEADILELLSHFFENMGYCCICAPTLTKALKALYLHDYFLCLTDMRLPDGDGIELVKHIQINKPELPVAMITAYGNVEGAVNTLKAGAFDYVSKPIELESLKKLIQSAEKMEIQTQFSEDKKQVLVGDSPKMRELINDIGKVSRSLAPVFIYGESGVGKELVAKLIHSKSPRSAGPFIPINCGAIPSELMESEFFGHKKGSFTGAISDQKGLFESAQGGTLFLDEIAELPIPMQVKLLRAIQEKSIRPIGETKEINIDVRILSASHKALIEEIDKETFRKDLYYRINVIELKVPALREHLSDVPLLVDALLERLRGAYESPKISKEAILALENYTFPGNVRELENILERALALCDNQAIEIDDLKLPEITNACFPLNTAHDETLTGKIDTYLDDTQREVIINALEETKWNRTAAAKLLGISFRALRYRLKKLKIE